MSINSLIILGFVTLDIAVVGKLIMEYVKVVTRRRRISRLSGERETDF